MEAGVEVLRIISPHLSKTPEADLAWNRLKAFVHQYDEMCERQASLENLVDRKEDEIVCLLARLRDQDKQMIKTVDMMDHSPVSTIAITPLQEEDIKASLLLDPSEALLEGSEIIMEEINQLDNVESDKLKLIEEELLKKAGRVVPEDPNEPTLEQANACLGIRLKLEQARRIRAQNVIGEIEREKSALQNQLERNMAEFAVKTQNYEEVRVGCDYKVNKVTNEMKKLEAKSETMRKEKDKKITDLQKINEELFTKLEQFEDRYSNQLEVSKTLQNELQVSYEETQCLVKEMDMLNLMFAELEHHIFYPDSTLVLNTPQIEFTHNGKKLNIEDVLQSASSQDQCRLLQESCFNEVTTKNGTRMVLSVSKTFIKLKDLILEKKTLEEQLNKMKHINQHLCSQVNLHEEKLWSITDELNSTWNYVSKIKEQHKKLHSAEQILRAELAEKRQILNKLRTELEESRKSMDLVKQKTAESETQWLALKADFAERRRNLFSSSESGFSEVETEEAGSQVDDSSVSESLPTDNSMIPTESEAFFGSNDSNEGEGELEAVDDEEENYDDMSIPDPFGNDSSGIPSMESSMLASTLTITDEMLTSNDESMQTIFFPSMSYLAHVPSNLHPPLFGADNLKGKNEFALSDDAQDDSVLEEVDDNVRELITRLMSSTARGAFLANRLSDMHRRIANGDSLTENGDFIDDEEVEEADNDEDNKTDLDLVETDVEDSEEDVIESSSINDIESIVLTSEPSDSPENPSVDSEDDPERPMSSQSSASNTSSSDEEGATSNIPPAPPLPSFSLIPPSAGITVRPTYNDHYIDDDSDDEERRRRNSQSPESSTAVTRFLIKHLPKQLSKLRNDKAELEERIQELELVVSDQRNMMAEQERRAMLEKSKAKSLEDQLKKESDDAPATYTFPIVTDRGDLATTWEITSRSQPVSHWLTYLAPGESSDCEVVLPSLLVDVVPLSATNTIITTVRVDCIHPGTFTLHITGIAKRPPEVKIHLVESKKE